MSMVVVASFLIYLFFLISNLLAIYLLSVTGEVGSFRDLGK